MQIMLVSLSVIFIAYTKLFLFRDPPVEYAVTMTTGVLHSHLEKYHAFEYLEACRSYGWNIKIKLLVQAVNDSNPVTYLSPQLPFSIVRFKAALVNCIITNDQVSIP